MKNGVYRAISLLLVLVILSGPASAVSSGQKYTDVSGHWAEETLRQALRDGIIVGYGNRAQPDGQITAAEAVTMLCRVFSSQTEADLSHVGGLKKNDWYYTFAAKAVSMGVISPNDGRLNMTETLTRSKAFTLLAEAFQIIPARPDFSALSRYSDGDQLCGKDRSALAALTSAGLVKGHGGSLHLYDSVTRAEFLSVMYRIISGFEDASKAASASGLGGVLLNGDWSASDMKFAGNVYCNGRASHLSLENVSVPVLVLRSDTLASFSAEGCSIDRLVLAARSGDITVWPQGTSKIQTAVAGTGGGCITFVGNISNVEVTGDGRVVEVSSSMDSICISGSNNKVTIAEGASARSVRLLSSGSGNQVTVNGTVASLEISGGNASVGGTGAVDTLVNNTTGSAVTVQTAHVAENKSYGLEGAKLNLKVPGTLPAGKTLEASVSITGREDGKVCRGAWYLDDRFVSASNVTLKAGASASFQYQFQYSRSLSKSAKLSFVLSCRNEDGSCMEAAAQQSITLENYSEDYYRRQEMNLVLSKVKTGYRGDYTLAWAKTHDYSVSDKELWVDARKYSSKTDYLIWVNIAYQRVNVFLGAAGKWKLIKTFLVGTGAKGTDTPVGTYDIIGRLPRGWSNSVYTVRPVLNFKDPSYGFHSRIYYPGTTVIQDARIGFPCSHGCIRMYTPDINWMYQYIPLRTTVVVY